MNNMTTSYAHAVKGSEDVRHHTCSTRGCGAATRIMRRGAAPMLAVACRAQVWRSRHGLTLLHRPAQRRLRMGPVLKNESRSGPRYVGGCTFGRLPSRTHRAAGGAGGPVVVPLQRLLVPGRLHVIGVRVLAPHRKVEKVGKRQPADSRHTSDA